MVERHRSGLLQQRDTSAPLDTGDAANEPAAHSVRVELTLPAEIAADGLPGFEPNSQNMATQPDALLGNPKRQEHRKLRPLRIAVEP